MKVLTARFFRDLIEPTRRALLRRPDRDIVVRIVLASIFPLVAGAMAQWLSAYFGVTQLSFVFMASVICAGAFFGLIPALVAAIIAFGIYNFFLVDPRFSLQLASADDFVTLVLFLVAALITGGLAGRLRDQSQLSRHQLRTTQTLFEASRRLARTVEMEEIDAVLIDSVERALAIPAIVLRGQPSSPWGVLARSPNAPQVSASDIDWCQRQCLGETLPGREGQWRMAPLLGQEAPLGALAVHVGAGAIMDDDDQRTLESLASLGAVALDRSTLIIEMTESRALAQSERLRSALLSSLSHDFRTPLATILASATSLIDYEPQFDAAAKQDLLQSIRDETERMTRFVANLLDMTRLEAGALKPRLANINISEVVIDAAAHLNRKATAKGVRIVRSNASILACADPVLLEQALMNLLDNAIVFSSSDGAIEVNVSGGEADAPTITITDQGPGIPPASLPLVFDKFYRAPEHASRGRGVGLGLSIAKGLIEAMGGGIAAESPIVDGHGTRVIIRLRRQAT